MPSTPPFEYVILGAGRQGTAAAYDLVRFGQAERVVLADANLERAQQAAERVNRLAGQDLAIGQCINVKDSAALQAVLEPADVALSAVPYYFNLDITRAAIEARTSLCDMGGNTEIVRAQLALDPEAAEAGISVVPDCGMGPGLVNTLGVFAMEQLDEPREIFIYDAGLPQNPVPPWNYEMTFHINGLTNEMDGQAVFIRDGKLAQIPTLTEPEFLDFPPLGRLEADVTSGGTSTAAWTFEGKLQTFENKVMRYPGHYEWLRAYKALGLFSEMPVQVGEQWVTPRQVYHTLLEPKISTKEPRDICVMRSVGKGLKDGRQQTVTIDLVDRYDPETGFTGMERLTGWHASIMMIFQALGQIAPGALPVEKAISATPFMEAIAERGIHYEIRWE